MNILQIIWVMTVVCTAWGAICYWAGYSHGRLSEIKEGN